MGFLVHSFNDMTKRLRRAARTSSRPTGGGDERANLAIVLARLSTA